MSGTIGRERTKRYWWAAALALTLLAFGLYAFDLDAQGLWLDEIITVRRSNLSLPGIVKDLLETRNHVPLYFVMMHLWQKGGIDEFWVRFPSLVWAVLGVAMTVRLGQDLDGGEVGLCAGLLLAFAPLYNWHAQDARMYSMAAFWVVAATWAFLRAWQNHHWRWWILCGACVLVAAYTHLLTPIIYLAQAFLIVLRRRRNRSGFGRWCLTMVVAGTLYVAWLVVLARSGGFATAYTGWIPTPVLLDLPLTYYVLSVGATAGWKNTFTFLPLVLYLVLTATLIWRWRTLAASRRWHLAVMSCAVAFMPLLVWVASQRQSIYVDRYFLPLLPLLMIWVAVGLRVVWRWRRALAWGMLAVLLAFDIWSLANQHFNPRYSRDDWRGAAGYIRARARSDDAMLTYVGTPFRYYSLGELELQSAWAVSEAPAAFAERTAQVVDGKDRLWLVLPLTILNNHGFCEERDELAIDWVDRNPYVQWLVGQYTLLDSLRLPGVQVMLFGLDAK
jgi:hypothetical protein